MYRNALFALILFGLVLNELLSSIHAESRQNRKNTSKKRPKNPNCINKSQLDLIMAQQYTFGNSGRKFPEGLSQIPHYCNTTEQLNHRLESFINECVIDSFTKSTIQILVNTVRRETRQLCRISSNKRPTKRQSQLFDAAPCSNSVKQLHQKCIDQAILYFQDSLGFKESKQRLGYICCNMHKLEDCLTKPMQNSNSVCKPRHSAVVLDFIDSIQGNMLNFLCGDYTDESSFCDKFKRATLNATVPAFRSLVVPMIDALNLFD